MSRISVEPAKKLGDHSAANPIAQKVKLKKGKAVGAESIETTGTGAKSSNSEKNLTSGSGDADSKKNKKEQEPEVMNKKKAEFFEMMKPRSKAKHWDNDDQAIAPVADVAVDDTNGKGYSVVDHALTLIHISGSSCR